MQRLEVSGAVRPIYGSLAVKRLMICSWPYLRTMQPIKTTVENLSTHAFKYNIEEYMELYFNFPHTPTRNRASLLG